MQIKASRQAFKVALIYVIVAGAWILFSDELLKRLVHDPDARVRLSIYKGWAFVLLTGGLLHLSLHRVLSRWAEQAEQRRQAEAATRSAMDKLRRSEEQLRLVAEASADGLWDWNIEADRVELSPRYWQIIGFAPGERVADREFFKRLVHPEDWPGVLAATTDHLAGKTADSKIEYRMITKEGIEKWIWGRGKVVERAADGSPLRMVGTISDITLQKISELLLVKSEQRYRSLFENMNEGFALCRMIFEDGQPSDFVHLAVNQMFTTLTGLQDVVGKRVTDILPGLREQDPELFDLYARVVRTGTPEKTERFLKSLQMWFSLAVYSTEPETFVVVFDVITERKRAEAALQLSDFSVNHSSLPTFWIASNGRIVRANDAASALMGYTETELLQLAVTDLDPDVPGARWPADWQELRAQKHKRVEARHRHKDGHLIPVEVDLNWFEFGGQEYNFAFVRDVTEHRQVQAELAQANSLLNAALEATADGILVVDGQGSVVNFNQKFLQLWQIPATLMASKTDHQLLQYVLAQLAEPDRFRAKVEELYHTPQANSWDELKFKDGRIFERYSQPQRLNENTVGRVWSFRDVTKRRRAEAAQKHERNQLRTLIDHLPDMVYVRDSASRFLIANQAFARRMGSTSAGLIGKTDADFYAADAAACFAANDRKVLAGGEILDHECTVDFPNGESLRIVSTKVPLKTARGEVVGLVGVIHDITEQKRAEAARHENESLLRSILENSREVIFVKDRECRFVFMNPAGYRLTGLTPDKLLGHSKADFHPNAAEVERFLADDRRVMESGQMETIEEEITAADGSKHIFLTSKVARLDSQGKVIGMIGVAHDITQRKRAELEIQRQAAFARFNPNPVMELSAAGEILYFNAASLQMAGVLGQNHPAGMLPPHIADIARDCLAAGKPLLRLELQTGNRTISWSFFPVESTQTVHGYAGDITERRLAEHEIRESEQRYRQLFELESDAVILVDCETHLYVDANFSALQLYGYSREEFLRMKPEDVSEEPDLTRAIIGGGSFHVPLRWHRKKNGERFAAEITANPINYRGRPTELAAIRDITTRQQVLEKLGETTEQLLEAQHIAGLGSYAFDVPNGTWTGSAVLYELFGIVEAGITQDLAGWLQIIHPEERAEMQRYLQEDVLKNRAPFDRTYRIIRANDREERWVHGLGKLVLDDRGQVVRMVGVIQDITERKRAERALLESQALYSSLVMQLPIGIFRKDDQGRFVLVNAEFCQLKGMQPEDFLGKTPLEVLANEASKPESTRRANQYAAEGEDHHRQIMRTGLPIELDEEYTLPNGEKQFVHVMKFPVVNVDGKITGTQGVQFNITERKRAEEQAHLQFSALKAAANAIVITDRQGKIVWVNPAFTKLTGYTEAEAVGSNPRVLKSGEHPPSFYANMWTTIITGNPWHGELVNKHKDGRLYTEDLTITPVRNDNGQITHFVAIKQDVSERRQFESRLQQAQKMEAIGTLAGGIAHDFNNILAAIFGYSNLLQQDTEGNSAAQDDIGEILKAAGRAKDLVQQILTFSRQREQKRQVIRLDTVVKEATKFLRASLPAQIKIEMNLAEDAPAVLADPTQIYQVTMNLATNALHAMDGQPGRLTVALDVFVPDNKFIQGHSEFRAIQYTRLTVADTGLGMDAKTLARIFEPFFTTKPVGKGTGLGLAVVHGIVQSHDGAITVESQPGQGTTFCLYFPGQSQTETLTNAAAAGLPRGHGEKILLVDDEPALTATFQRLLMRLNYQVTICNSAREALALFQKNPAQFELVITDLTMPEMNGLELARQIRGLRPELRVILASGFAAELTSENLHAAGVSELLEKPISMPALADALERTFAKA